MDSRRVPCVTCTPVRTLAAAREVLAAQPGQAGALICMGSRWVRLDLLAGPGLFARAWPRRCAGYVTDAIGREPGPLAAAGRRARARSADPGPGQTRASGGPGRGVAAPHPRGGPRQPGGRGTNGPPDGVSGESVRTHGDTGRSRLRVILSHVPRGNQLARQWQLLQLIDHPARLAVDDAARKLDCTVRTIWRDLDVLQKADFP